MSVKFKMESISLPLIFYLGLAQYTLVSGTNIFLAIPQNKDGVGDIDVFVTTNTLTSVTMESLHPGVDKTVQVSPETGYQMSLPSSLMQNGSRVESKGVLVSSEDDIGVSVVIRSKCCGGEGYRALPAKHLGKEYLVCSMYNSSATVIASENDTRINITKRFSGSLNFNGTNYFYGDTISVTLDRLQTLQLMVENSYLIGSTVKANKPIAVISGQYYGSLNPGRINQLDKNQMMEFLPSVNKFGRRFIVPQIMNSSYVRLVVFTPHHDAHINVSAQGFHRTLRVRKYSSSIVTVRADRPSIFTSNNQVMLTLYPHGVKTFMTYIPSTEQYIRQAKFFVPDGFVSYVALITKAADVDAVRIDGRTLYPRIDDVKAVTDGHGIYLTINSRVAPGQHVISHVETDVKFACILYGFNNDTSYGFPL